jgi:altered-inheritance-of-mitochondria protein 13
LSRESIQNELASLKKKLENRKKVKEVGELDKSVEKAREDVISCLRGNDRRPLDCWREVEAFKREVGRVEKDWIEKVVR